MGGAKLLLDNTVLLMSSHKIFRIKSILAKKSKQNYSLLQQIWMNIGNGFGPRTHMESLEEALGSQLRSGTALAVGQLGEAGEPVDGILPLCPSFL